MSKLFDRFKKKKSSVLKPTEDPPMIGDEVFGKFSAREALMPRRKELQEQYKSQGRDPDSLAKVPANQRDESFWMAYVDSLMLFERFQEASVYVDSALAEYPHVGNFHEMKQLIAWKLTKHGA